MVCTISLHFNYGCANCRFNTIHACGKRHIPCYAMHYTMVSVTN